MVSPLKNPLIPSSLNIILIEHLILGYLIEFCWIHLLHECLSSFLYAQVISSYTFSVLRTFSFGSFCEINFANFYTFNQVFILSIGVVKLAAKTPAKEEHKKYW